MSPQRSSGSCQHSSEEQVPTYSAIHYFVSSSLPNCCELFAAAIAASPFFSCSIHAPTGPVCPFCSARFAGFNLSQKVAAPTRMFLPGAQQDRRPPHECLLRQPHGLRQSVIANEQIHLNPFAGSLFVNWQAQRAQRAALHAHAQNRGVIGI